MSKNVDKSFDVTKFPVFNFEESIISSVLKYEILFIAAETGSGKTTIIPQILYQSGIFQKIIVSQTKRLAAISAAKYVSNYFESTFGDKVGYSVRFDENANNDVSIKYVTDGILFKDMYRKPFCSENVCLILDEFHERTIFTDLILALIKKSINLNRFKRLIIMSASGNSSKIARYFNGSAGKLILPGKLFKVAIFYLRKPQSNFILAITITIVKLHLTGQICGDILVFLPGIEEIEKVFNQVQRLLITSKKNFALYKLFASLPLQKQKEILKVLPVGYRKIILSTNIAESSLTIPGITIVIDCGLTKQKILNWKTGIETFKIYPISKSEAYQRAGRAGRKSLGKCFRLFTFSDYKILAKFPKPEIERIDLATILLLLCSFDNKNLFGLEFISLPQKWGIIRSLETLYVLGAIDNNLFITFFGKCISFFPTDVKLARSIIEALRQNEKKVLSWVLASAASFSTNAFPYSKQSWSSLEKNIGKMGDFFFFAKYLFKYQLLEYSSTYVGKIRPNSSNDTFCRTALDIKSQFLSICNRLSFYFKKNKICFFQPLPFQIKFKICFVSGFFLNAAKIIQTNRKFEAIISGIIGDIHPQSSCKMFLPKVLIFKEMFLTHITYMRGILPIRFIWLLFFGSKIYI